jgi:hypothetical protein
MRLKYSATAPPRRAKRLRTAVDFPASDGPLTAIVKQASGFADINHLVV